MAFSANDISFDERFAALDDHQARFVSKVYSGLTASLVVAAVSCAAGVEMFHHMDRQQVHGIMLGFLVLEVIMVLGLMFVRRLGGVFGWVFLFAFAGVTGVTLAPVIMSYAISSGIQTVSAALGITAALFLSLTAYVRWSGKDFSYLGGFLFMATIGLVVSGFLLMIFPSHDISYIKACIGALVFCGWILYDTSAVTRQYYQQDNVVGAILSLYLDILNLFLFLLQILGNGRRRD